MIDAKYIFGVVGITVLILGAGVLGARMTSTPKIASESSNAQVEVAQSSYDWGTIGINDGKVQAQYEIKNTGSDPLKLANVVTSCSCTTAILTRGEEKSPVFGMHTKSSYVMEVPSGETALLTIEFDPLFHGPTGVGPITREINIDTNDTKNQKLSFTATANVVAEK